MSNHFTLEVLVNEHHYEMRRNADNYRLLQAGRPVRPSLAARLGRAASRAECLFAGWRYRVMVRMGATPQLPACS
jgi:hypothetical protein